MKSRLICVLLAVFVACFAFVSCASTEPLPEVEPLPFTKGVDLTRFFERGPGGLPNLNKYDEADFACLKAMGVDIIRLACSFDNFTDKVDGTGKIHEIVLEKIDQVCDWAEKYKIYLIIDNHNSSTFDTDPHRSDYELMWAQLQSFWSQLAPRYKDRSEYILYEVMNEPNCQSASKFYKIQQDAIDLIRSYDTKHTIIVTCTNWSSPDDLIKMKPYKDPNLIYTFHFYDPERFTGQYGTFGRGEEWQDLADIPFPYDKARMPQLKGRSKGTYMEDYFKNVYPKEGTVKYINDKIKKIADWSRKYGVRTFAGEIGANVRINPVDRLAWSETVVSALQDNNIPYCVWGIEGETGFLTSIAHSKIFPDDIDEAALNAYGFTMPYSYLTEQTNLALKDFPNTPFVVYDGVVGKGITERYYWGEMAETPSDDPHGWCFKVWDATQGNGWKIWLPNIITSKFEGYEGSLVFSFSVKFTSKDQSFTLHLRDTDGGEELMPWAKCTTVSALALQNSLGEWVTVEVPVSSFIEEDGTWSDITQNWQERGSDNFVWSRFESLWIEFESETPGEFYVDDIVVKMK